MYMETDYNYDYNPEREAREEAEAREAERAEERERERIACAEQDRADPFARLDRITRIADDWARSQRIAAAPRYAAIGNGLWIVALLAACGASLARGLKRREFAFVAYGAVYGYVGVSSLLIRNTSDFTLILVYFVLTAIAMIAMLVLIARRFGRPE